jgi:hypothetical protein
MAKTVNQADVFTGAGDLPAVKLSEFFLFALPDLKYHVSLLKQML